MLAFCHWEQKRYWGNTLAQVGSNYMNKVNWLEIHGVEINGRKRRIIGVNPKSSSFGRKQKLTYYMNIVIYNMYE